MGGHFYSGEKRTFLSWIDTPKSNKNKNTLVFLKIFCYILSIRNKKQK